MKIQFTIWSPKINNSKLYHLYAKDENNNQIGKISYNLTEVDGIIQSINISASVPILDQFIDEAKKQGFDVDAFSKKFTTNIKRYESNGKLSRTETEWFELSTI
jgi:hypothetical protein